MNIKTQLLSCFVLGSVAFNLSAVDYTVKGELPGMDGARVYLYDYEMSRNIDSVKVVDGAFAFSGRVEWPKLARLECGVNFSNCVLDSVVTVDFASHLPLQGSRLNRRYLEYDAALHAIEDELARFSKELDDHGFEQPQKGEVYKMLFDRKKPLIIDLLETTVKNNDNGVGQAAMMRYSPVMTGASPDNWDALKDSIPSHLKSTSLYAEYEKMFAAIRRSSVGQPLIDFSAKTPDGRDVRLSDYVGKGKYVLVDFWASWCGPCRKEAAETLKPLYERFKTANFEMLGVGVWDSAERIKAAIEGDGNEWPQIIANGMEPMELYGFNYIPMILLFDPDGTIMHRELRGDRIVSAVESALAE